ncbi:MAG TPA: endonuclease III [Ignavibacteriales bacterium]|nr:endonuclease III [Ignavibacteriales bacterium]
MSKEKLSKINKILIREYGLPRQENPDPDPVDILIATILSQNTNDRNSYKSFLNLKKKYPQWKSAARADLDSLEEPIKPAGFSRPKARAIKDVLNYLLDKYGKVSLDYLKDMETTEAIKSLISHKGIGIKTAQCVMMFAFHRNVCPVDRHIFRVLNRIGVVKAATPEKTSVSLNKMLPEGAAHSLHANLIRFGREICRKTLPNCSICPLLELCEYDNKNMTEVNEYKGGTFLLLDHVG